MDQPIRTIVGSNQVGLKNDQTRATLEESRKMLRVCQDYGLKEIDTSPIYSLTTCETFLGMEKENLSANFAIGTKANPYTSFGRSLDAQSLRDQLEASLARLRRDKVDIFYLHLVDYKTPLRVTLEAVNSLHKENKFNEFGLCNYPSWIVGEIYAICKENSWVLPTVYQGMYNILTRAVERELIPCLRYYGIRFYAFSPLAGGILTGKYKPSQNNTVKFPQSVWFWKQEYFDEIEVLRASLTTTYGEGVVSLAEAAYRWLYHHSALKSEFGDVVLVGSSKAEQLKRNLEYTKKGTLDDKIVEVIENMWKKTSYVCADYHKMTDV